MQNNNLQIIPLGGLGEIGKNITAIEYMDEIIVIDCGVGFPDDSMYGVDLVLPDINYLLNNKEKVKGFFLTHGHEDHIGSLPYILKQLNIPVYGTKLTLALVENKLKEHQILDICNLNIVNPLDIIKLNHFEVEFIRVTHSIADACALAIHTPLGTIFHTGDFKIDYTPIDNKVIDLKRISELGREGVLLMMADSTNVERVGHTISEKSIGETFNRLFKDVKERIIVSTFASNIHRIQQIIDASVLQNRKIIFSGRSMIKNSEVAMNLNYLHIPDGYLIDIDDLDKQKDSEVTIITTGSQGEPMGGLARIAFDNHRKIKIKPNDLFILSASPIPGNDKMVSTMINQLFRKGAHVIYEDLEDVHVSGHAYQEELKLIHTLVKPKYFLPVHGEYRHLVHHSNLAKKLGMDSKHIFIMETGQVLEISNEKAFISKKVKTGVVLVDGSGVGDVGSIVLRDRKYLAEDGMVTIVICIERESFSIITGPDIVTRGFIYARNNEDILRDIKTISRKEIEKCLDEEILEWNILKSNTKRAVENYLYQKTKRRPSIFPIIIEI